MDLLLLHFMTGEGLRRIHSMSPDYQRLYYRGIAIAMVAKLIEVKSDLNRFEHHLRNNPTSDFSEDIRLVIACMRLAFKVLDAVPEEFRETKQIVLEHSVTTDLLVKFNQIEGLMEVTR